MDLNLSTICLSSLHGPLTKQRASQKQFNQTKEPTDENLAEIAEELKDFRLSPIRGECEMKDMIARRLQIGTVQSHVGQIGRRPHHVDLVEIRLDEAGRG